MSLKEIAHQPGYEDVAHFSKFFKITAESVYRIKKVTACYEAEMIEN